MSLGHDLGDGWVGVFSKNDQVISIHAFKYQCTIMI